MLGFNKGYAGYEPKNCSNGCEVRQAHILKNSRTILDRKVRKIQLTEEEYAQKAEFKRLMAAQFKKGEIIRSVKMVALGGATGSITPGKFFSKFLAA